MKKEKKKAPAPPAIRKSGSVAMAEAGLKQSVYWLTAEDHEMVRQAAELRGQSVMSMAAHAIRTFAQQVIHDERRKADR